MSFIRDTKALLKVTQLASVRCWDSNPGPFCYPKSPRVNEPWRSRGFVDEVWNDRKAQHLNGNMKLTSQTGDYENI